MSYYPEAVCKMLIRNANDFHGKKPMPKEKAKKLCTAAAILKKYPKHKKALLEKDCFDKSRTLADAVAHDRYMWAIQHPSWVNS